MPTLLAGLVLDVGVTVIKQKVAISILLLEQEEHQLMFAVVFAHTAIVAVMALCVSNLWEAKE